MSAMKCRRCKGRCTTLKPWYSNMCAKCVKTVESRATKDALHEVRQAWATGMETTADGRID